MSAPAALLPPPWRNDLLSPTLNSRWRRKTTREEEKKASKQRASSGDSLEMRQKKKKKESEERSFLLDLQQNPWTLGSK